MKAVKMMFAVVATAMVSFAATALELQTDKFVIVSDYAVQAKELQEFLSQIAERKVEVLTPKQAEKKDLSGLYVWHLGNAPKDDTEKCGPEACKWRITPTEAWIWGGPIHGETIGIYDCMEEGLGVRFPWAGAVASDTGKTIAVLKTSGSWKTDYRIRAIRMRGNNETKWRQRMRDGKHDYPGYGHAFYKYWERFGCNQQHPEYFSMRRDGKRMPMGWSEDTAYNAAASTDKPARYISMCVSCEAFVDQVIADWVAAFKSKAGGAYNSPKYINLCENDASGDNICHCPACYALDAPRPKTGTVDWWPNWFSDRYVHFAKRVLEKARKYNPDAKAVMYAYNAMELPPQRESIDGDIIIGMVPTIFTREAVHNFVKGWKDAGVKEFFHRPNRRCYYSPNMLPVNFSEHFFAIIQDLTRFDGFIGADWDGGAQPLAVNWIADYVVMKCLQDPSKDYAYWESHYMDAFGSAKEDVRAYYRYWRTLWDERLEKDILELTEKGLSFNFMRGLTWNVDRYYSYDDFVKAGVFLDKALAHTDLNKNRRALVERLKADHDRAAQWLHAVVDRSEDNTRAYNEFCKARGLSNLSTGEKYSGDLAGVWRCSPERYGNVDLPGDKIVIVDLGHPVATAELKKHLDFILERDIPVVKGEAEVKEGQNPIYIGRQPHDEDAKVVETLKPEQGYWKFPKKGALKGKGYFYAATEDALENAVWDFLEFEMSVRWPWADEIAVKKRKNLHVYTWKNAWGPAKELVNHWVRFENEPKSDLFARRLRCGTHAPSGKAPVIELKLGEGLTVGSEEAAFRKLDKFLAENAHKDVSVVCTLPKPKSVLDWHVAYILNKQLLEPFKSFGCWENHYLQSYGAAASEMREAFKALRASYAAKGAADKAAYAAAAKFVDKALARTDLLAEDRARVEKVKAALAAEL